jgi:hypothetical protein
MDWSGVRERVAVLREHPAGREVFGASGHNFALEPPLSAADLADLEAFLQITLPDDYRTFLTDVGAGGAGPFYGIFPVRRNRDGSWFWDGDGGDLVDLARLGEPFPTERVPEEKLDALEAEKPDEDAYDDIDDFDAAYDVWDERLEALLYQPSMTVGAVCIAHEGCAYRDWLVVTGPACGTVWEDPRCLDMDLKPINLSFGDWYFQWLVATESVLQI